MTKGTEEDIATKLGIVMLLSLCIGRIVAKRIPFSGANVEKINF